MGCGSSAHLMRECTAGAAQTHLELLGQGVEAGFFYIDMGGIDMIVPEYMALLTILPSQLPALAEGLTVEILSDELSQMMPGHEWKVRVISATEFVVAFPSAQMLRMCTFGTTFTLPTNKIEVFIKASTRVPEAISPLSPTWVWIHGIPEEAKLERIVRLVA